MRSFQFYLVSTPIGNLGDMTSRAVETLREVDLVLAEDTRPARRLLAAHGIETPVSSYHDHNKERVAPRVLAMLAEGKRIALVSEAGTPVVSDPGYYLVRRLIEEGISYTAIPGPSAVLQALVLSGLPPDRFTFYGYVPRKAGQRRRLLLEAGGSYGTAILFESPHRLVRTLEEMAEILGEREVVVARELTKLHEEVRRGTADGLAAHYREAGVKGEVTLLVRGADRGKGGGTA